MNFWRHTKGLVYTAAAFLTLSCGPKITRPIEDGVSGPFTILSIPNRSEVLVINSSTSGEYDDGSISLYSAETNGKLSLKSSVSTKRLGLSGAVSEDGKMLAVSFVGDDARLRFFQIENDKITEKSNLSVETRSGEVFNQIRFFTPTSGSAAHYYLFGYSSSGKVLVYRVESDKSLRLFTLPDDMPGSNPESEGYAIAVGAPVFVEKSNLLVTFPLETIDTSSRRPKVLDSKDEKKSKLLSAYQIAVGEWDPIANRSGDIRALSALAVDFEKYLADGEALRNAAGYFPFIHTDKYALPAKDVAENPEDPARYRYAFQNSTYINHTGCLSRNPSAQFAEDSVLVSQNASDGAPNNRGTIIQLTGWDAIKTKIGTLETISNDVDYDYRKKVFFQMPELKLFSSAQDVLVGASRTTPIQILEQNSTCQPVWARIEIGSDRALSGMEKSTIITQIGDATEKPIESSNGLLSRGLGTVTVSGSQIFAASYSFDVLQTLKFENNSFSAVP